MPPTVQNVGSGEQKAAGGSLAYQLRDWRLPLSADAVPGLPKGLGSGTHVSMRQNPDWSDSVVKAGDAHVGSGHSVFLSADASFPLQAFITQAELIDVLDQIAQRELAQDRERGPYDPSPRGVADHARLLRELAMRVDMAARLRSIYVASLNQVAIVNPTHQSDIVHATPLRNMADE